MLPVTGYAEHWSVRQGDALRFMIGVAGGGRYRARVARIACPVNSRFGRGTHGGRPRISSSDTRSAQAMLKKAVEIESKITIIEA